MSTVLSSQRLATPRGRLPFTFVTAFLAVCVLLLSMATWAAATEPDATTTSQTAGAAPEPAATELEAATTPVENAKAVPADPAPAPATAPEEDAATPEAPAAAAVAAAPAMVEAHAAEAAKAAEAEQLAPVVALAAARAPKAVDVVDESGITITNRTQTDPNKPNVQWNVLDIYVPLSSADAAAAGDMPLQAGDSFYLNFPSSINMFAGAISIKNEDGTPVAECVISGGPGGPSADGTPDVKCIFNDAISQFSSFRGQMIVGAQLNSEQSGGEWTIDVNGDTTFEVMPPGGGVVNPAPGEGSTGIAKEGWFEYSVDPALMRWRIQIPEGTAADGIITIKDRVAGAPMADHQLVLTGAQEPVLRVRDDIPPTARDARYRVGNAACPWTFTPDADLRGFTAVISDACFDPTNNYTLIYFTKVTAPDGAKPGEIFGNSADINGVVVDRANTFYNYASGSINGPGFGGFGVSKQLTGPGASLATGSYTMRATWPGQVGGPVDLTVDAGGAPAFVNQLADGTVVTLTELAPAAGQVSWGDPVFAPVTPNDPAVVVAADGKSAVITIQDQKVVRVVVTNTAYGPPSIDIEKWSTNEAGPAYDAAGVLTNDGYAGDHDGTNVKVLDPTTLEQITFTVSNDGKDNLKDIKVSDQTTDGTVSLTDIKCTFPDGSIGTTWTGPFAVATQFTCIATLPALGVDATHADTATVVGVGVNSGTSVTDEDNWSGETPLVTPGIDIEKYNTAEGFPAGDRDTAGDAKEIPAGAVDPVTMTITNTGNQPLVNVKVSDKTLAGVTLTGLSCTFPDGSTGTTWTGPFMPGAKFDCTGTIPAQPAGAVHANTATVVATPAIQVDGAWVPQPDVPDVTDNDDYHDKTPPAPVVPPTTPPVSPPAPPVTTSRTPLAFTGSMLDTLLPIGALTLLAGAALIILGRRRVTPE